MKKWTRKEFLKVSMTAGASGWLASRGVASIAGKGSPNGDIRVAVVGFHGKGAQHISLFRALPGVKVAALCDVDSAVVDQQVKQFSARNEKVRTYTDYRKLLEDRSIDAVVIATPNHWHSLMTVWGCQAGKDVYVEKPISHNVWEGRKAVEAASKYDRIVQAGMQSRSDQALHEAFAYIREGNVGPIKWVRGFCQKPRPSIGRTSGPQSVPKTVDYDLWSGPAPLAPPQRNTPKWGTIHYDWHWFWNYGGGDIANQGVHEMDMCRWVLGQRGLPPAVMSIGGRFGYVDDAETPNTQIAVFPYLPAPLIFEVRGLPRKAGQAAMDTYRGVRVGICVQCEGGYFAGGAGGGGIYDNQGKKMKQFSSEGGGGHQANFIAAMRSRKMSDLNAPIIEGHISSALCHLANISYRLGRDTANETVREALASDALTKDSFERMTEHLVANNVSVAGTPVVVGPALAVEPGREAFSTHEDYDLGYWANTMLRRQYRLPFVVPERV